MVIPLAARPAIMRIQTSEPAAVLRAGANWAANKARRLVAAAPGPKPTVAKATTPRPSAGRRNSCADGAGGRYHHSAKDPGCSRPPLIRATSPLWPQQLKSVVNANQRRGDQHQQRKLDDHHTIDRCRSQDADCPKSRLHQADPDNGKPTQHHMPPFARDPSASAAAIRPNT